MKDVRAAWWCRAAAALTGIAAAFLCRSDPDEAWLIRAPLPADVQPLLALVLDTSAATSQSIVASEPYDPSRDYAASLPAGARCDGGRVYWRRNAGPAPDCTQQAGLALFPASPAAGLHCEVARVSLARHGFFIASRAAQWRDDGRYWSSLAPGSPEAVECRADRGRHGAAAGTLFAVDGAGGPWNADDGREIAWDHSPLGDPYVFFTGNFLNYLRSGPPVVERSIREVMLQSLAAALASTSELQVALVRVDPDGPNGGYVMLAPTTSAMAAARLEEVAGEAAAGVARLGETIEESSAWLAGEPVQYGTDPRADAEASDPLTPGRYRSPFEHACRPVSLAVLSAGETSDGCDATCLASLEQGIELGDLRDDLAGTQLAPVSWIAPAGAGTPGIDDSIADPLAFIKLVARSFQHDATVAAAPQLSAAEITVVTEGPRDPGVVFALTAPLARQRWLGNLFRYALRASTSPLAPPEIVDRDGEAAIDAATGLPRPASTSLWSDSPDANLLAGGAAGRLPAAGGRRIRTDLAGSRILDAANRLAADNVDLPRSAVGLAATDPESLEEILGWPSSLETLGDPGLHSPVVVDYPQSGEQLVFAATHDGLLHAFDADSGVERWAWMPRELLPRLPELVRNEVTTVRHHGIDGALVLHRHDPDGDGRIDADAGEHLWLLFGLGRGGNRYYALDVASADDPRLLWSVELPHREAEARAEPVVTRLVVDGAAQSAGDWIVLLAGGYDRRFDSRDPTGPGAGNGLHVLDAATGRRLWSAGGDDGDDLPIAGLASLASAPRALDLDGDGYLDRVYLVDVRGGLWRLDFTSGAASGEVAQATQIARLGTGAHRFHATPDASLARIGNESLLAIAVGSGWLARPRDPSIVDRMYMLFDRARPADASVLTEGNLHDATNGEDTIPPAAAGWLVRLERHGHGEKVVGPPATFDHVLRFQTYQPLPPVDSEPCGPPRADLRAYALDVRSGMPRTTAAESEEEEPEEIAGSGLPAGLRFGFPDRRLTTCEGCRPRPFGIIGGKTFDTGYAGDPVRTSWRKLPPPPASP